MFIQIHTLTSFNASLLNRDDTGASKKIEFGNAMRTRISSQCLKRHWREALMESGDFPSAIRSTKLLERAVLPQVVSEGVSEDSARVALRSILTTVTKGLAVADSNSLDSNTPILMGHVEARILAEATKTALKNGIAPSDVGEHLFKSNSRKSAKPGKNLASLLGVNASASAGVETALFGRFVTSDVLARSDSAVSVANAITVHAAAPEADFFSVVDDLNIGLEGSGHIGHSELSAGIFYGYVVIDFPQLVSNLTGCEKEQWSSQDLSLAKEVVEALVGFIAKVSPGAKKGATAPYSRASLMLVEVGKEAPRQLCDAYLTALPMRTAESPMTLAIDALSEHLACCVRLDEDTETKRAFVSVSSHAELEKLAQPMQSYKALAQFAVSEVA